MPAAPWNKIGDWNAATNTPTLTAVPTLAAGDYYEVTVAGTFFNIPFEVEDYLYAEDGSWKKFDANDQLALFIKQAKTFLNNKIDQGTAVLTAHAGRLNVLEGNVPVPIAGFTGGTQQSAILALADVTGSTMNLPGNSWMDVEWVATYSAAATTTGAFFSVNGTAGADYFRVEVIGDCLAADGNARTFSAPNGGQAFPSSRATSGNKALIRVRMHTTTAGTAVLRFASEVNASAITITALQGYSQRLP